MIARDILEGRRRAPRWLAESCRRRPGGRIGRRRVAAHHGGAPFTLTDLPNLAAWYRGDSLEDGTATDLSGNGRDAPQMAGLTSTVSQQLAAGQLAFKFDGNAAFHVSYDEPIAQPATLYFVITPTSLENTQFFFDSDDSTSRVWCEVDTVPRYRVFAGATFSSMTATTKITALCVVLNGASSAIYQNDFGTAAAQDDGGTDGIDGVTIGAAFNGGSGFTGLIHDLPIFAAAHDAATRAKVAGYLARYEGLTVTT